MDACARASTVHRRLCTRILAFKTLPNPLQMDRFDDDDTLATNTGGRTTKRRKTSKPESKLAAWWCEESVARLFSLRYKTALAERFDSKNNNQKMEAYEMLASELSIEMNRCFTSKQVKDKFAKLRMEWSSTKPSLPTPTGNEKLGALPANFDSMMEFWGSKEGLSRASLFATDEEFETHEAEYTGSMLADEAVVASSDAEEECVKVEKKDFSRLKSSKTGSKGKTNADALEAGLFAVKDGLVSLGQAMLQSSSNPVPESTADATLSDVVVALQNQSAAITEQSSAISKLLEHLLKQ